ncbi:hypothetical protein [Vibrio sagamiensis]|nr:hypothetical protein [Vibrio sagamiensis]PNQ53922.1 hypothetical protein C1141_18650 [Vibrio agarivorans]
MIINQSTIVYSSTNEQKKPQLEAQQPEILLAQAHKVEKDFESIDSSLALLDKNPGNISILKQIAAHQQALVAMVVGTMNSEFAIACALANAIESYNERLGAMMAWTEGGQPVIGAALQEMLDNILARGEDGFSNCELEDLFQLALLEMRNNPDAYPGFSDLLNDPQFVESMGHLLEFTGSGSHKYMGGLNGDPTKMKFDYDYIYQKLSNKGLPPAGSVAEKCFLAINSHGGIEKLKTGMNLDPYVTNGEGWAVGTTHWWGVGINETVGAEYLSPANTLVILSFAAQMGITPDQYLKVVSGNLSDMMDIIDIVEPDNLYSNIYDYLYAVDGEHWEKQDDGSFNYYPEVGIPASYLNSIFEDFPGRALTEEEVKELQNISDQIKMLQQTLKYWLSVIRDERLAITRNI